MERIIPQSGIYAESVISSLKTRRVGRVPGRRICVADLAVDRVRGGKMAHNSRRCARVTENLAAVDVKRVLNLIREGMALDRHGKVQLPTFGRYPRIHIADIRLRIGDRCGRVEMVGGPGHCRESCKKDQCNENFDFEYLRESSARVG